MVEQRPFKSLVPGSNPGRPTKRGEGASLEIWIVGQGRVDHTDQIVAGDSFSVFHFIIKTLDSPTEAVL